MGRLLGLLRPASGRMVRSVLLGTGTVACGVGLMATSAWLVSRAGLHPSIAVLQVAIVGVRFFGLFRGVLRYGERLTSHDATLRIHARLRARVFEAVEPLGPLRLAPMRGGDLLARLVGDVEALDGLFLGVVGPAAVAALTGSLVVAWLAGMVREAVLPALGALLLAGVAVPLALAQWGRRVGAQRTRAHSELAAGLVETARGLPDLLLAGDDGPQLQRLGRAGRALETAGDRRAAANAAATAVVSGLADLAALGVLVAGIGAAAAGRLDGVWIASLALATLAVFEAVVPLPAAAETAGAVAAAARRVFALTDAAPAVVSPEAPRPLPADARIEVRGLRFRHSAGRAAALDGVDLDLAPGRIVALVGPSGAGKSSLLALLQRHAEPDAGTIRLGGVDVRALDPAQVRRRFAVVEQRPHLFTGTLAENLGLARADASDEELRAAIVAASLDGLVATLPRGLDTWIGEQGLELSGGERQRVAIARAWLSSAPLLLLDEPTAHLDAETARTVLGRLLAPGTARGVLLATHRLLGLESADEILVLDEGHVVERGRHEELLGRAGTYRRLWDRQLRDAPLDEFLPSAPRA